MKSETETKRAKQKKENKLLNRLPRLESQQPFKIPPRYSLVSDSLQSLGKSPS